MEKLYLNSDRQIKLKEETKGLISGVISTEAMNSYDFKVSLNAFADSIDRRKYKGVNGIKFLFDHDKSKAIGIVKKIYQEDSCLKIDCKLNLDLPLAQEIYSNLKMGIGAGFSVGFRVEDSSIEQGVKNITEGDLFEVSFTYFPANQDCAVEKVLHMNIKEQELLSEIRDDVAFLKKQIINREFSSDCPTVSFDHGLMAKLEAINLHIDVLEKKFSKDIEFLKDNIKTPPPPPAASAQINSDKALSCLKSIEEFMKEI